MNGRPRTHLAACVVAALLLLHLLSMATGGFEHWTFESLRRARALEGHLRAPDVTLVDSAGRPLRPWPRSPDEDAAPADVLVVDFVFTRCPSVCQSLGSAFERMQAELAREPARAGSPRVRLLSVSFDPGHDDAAALQAYARRHRADASRWTVAVPAGAAETEALLKALDVVVIPDGWGGYVHNAGLHVIDARGRLAGIHELDAWPDALSHARALARQAAP